MTLEGINISPIGHGIKGSTLGYGLTRVTGPGPQGIINLVGKFAILENTQRNGEIDALILVILVMGSVKISVSVYVYQAPTVKCLNVRLTSKRSPLSPARNRPILRPTSTPYSGKSL